MTNINFIDSIDLKILDMLQNDSSIPNSRLSKKVGLSPSSALSRVKRLKREGYIKKYVAILNEETVGKSTVAFVFVTLFPHKPDVAKRFVEKIQDVTHVMECYHITGKADYLLRVVARDIPEYRDLLVDTLISMDEVESVQTWFVLKTEKRDTRLPIKGSQVVREKRRNENP